MNKLLILTYLFLILFLFIFSYGFVDANLQLSSNNDYILIHEWFKKTIFQNRLQMTITYAGLISCFFGVYLWILNLIRLRKIYKKEIITMLGMMSLILLLSFPAFSYDIFNYILTAKMTFFYHENPYLVMPIEMLGEPMLAFTRAANKVALYGPVWIILTGIPYFLGLDNIWLTIIAFKLINIFFYLGSLRLIYLFTGSWWQVSFFAFNPLIIFEILISGHNDIAMMFLALTAFWLNQKNQLAKKIIANGLLIASVLVKGATLVLWPLLLIKLDENKIFRLAYWFMIGVFLLTPLREELYPWYAVWFLTFASVIRHQKEKFIHVFSIVLSFGLTLRYLPYLYTGSYGGNGPFFRLFITIIPVSIYSLWYIYKNLSDKILRYK